MASIDQQWTTNDGATYTGTVNRYYLAQRIIAGATGNLVSVDLYIYKVGTGGGNMTVGIYSDNGSGLPNTLIGSTAAVASSGLTTSLAWKSYTLGSAAPITSGTTYHIVLGRTSGDNTNCVSWGTDNANGYGGRVSSKTTGAWVDYGAQDQNFKTYYDPPPATGYKNLLLMGVG